MFYRKKTKRKNEQKQLFFTTQNAILNEQCA